MLRVGVARGPAPAFDSQKRATSRCFHTGSPVLAFSACIAPSLPPEMLRTLLISTLVFVLLYVGLVTIRYGLALAEEEREGRLDAA